jgi:hypothetical protein
MPPDEAFSRSSQESDQLEGSDESDEMDDSSDMSIGHDEQGQVQKREEKAKLKKGHYHILKDKAIEFANLAMSLLPNTTAKGKNQAIKAMCNLRSDPELGLGRIAVQYDRFHGHVRTVLCMQ